MPANAVQQHDLRPLLLPGAVAVVGVSQREGALGRTVLRNALDGPLASQVHAVDPRHREVMGRRCWPSIASIGEPIDLALIATPADVVLEALDDCGAANVKAAIVLAEAPSGTVDDTRAWRAELRRGAVRNGLRLLGPGAFGLVRSDIGLNASISGVPVQAGRVALVAQSGAVCTAMLDFAAPLRIGFSTVVSLGSAIDVDFGEMLDFLLLDEQTDSILLYVETVRDARRFHSALRAAARIKPVAVLKSGRAYEPERDPASPSADAVFDCAIRRAGTVRVQTYTQLFAAARILALGRVPRDDRIAIVANGAAPARLAADAAFARNVRLATFSPATQQAVAEFASSTRERSNPLDVRADATPERMASALHAVLIDDAVDAAVVLHVPRPAIDPADMAQAVAQVAGRAGKPVLAAWLGALDRPGVLAAFDAGGVANFYTPENAIDAFSFLAAYRRHQQWLLEVPPPHAQPPRPDVASAQAVLRELEPAARAPLSRDQARRLLAAFGVQATPAARVSTEADAKRAARKLGYPVVLDSTLAASPRFRNLQDARSVARAFRALGDGFTARDADAPTVRVRKCSDAGRAGEIRVAVHTDATFGPVISLGATAQALLADTDRKLMLPPLNRRLALDLVASFEVERAAMMLDDATRESLVELLLGVSALVCVLPWVVEIELDPVTLAGSAVSIDDVRVIADTGRTRLREYAHMAIHPYPAELVDEMRARNGARVDIRPIRPEDAQMERAFVGGLSERTRYLRFFYPLNQLTPAMLARFTQIDYDRELALVAVVEAAGARRGGAFAGVARYVENPDRVSAEYAIVVDDDWQHQGIGLALMQRLIAAAKRKGLVRLEGAVLAENAPMLAFVHALGFTTLPDPGDAEQVITRLELDTARPGDVA